MAVVVSSSGTQAATISTEHTLYAASTAGMYVLTVNLANLTGSDVVELRVYNKTLTGDTITVGNTATQAYLVTYVSAQSSPVVASVPVVVGYAATFTLKQTAGTGRSFPWAVLAL